MYGYDLTTIRPGQAGLNELLKELGRYGIKKVVPRGPRGTSGQVQRLRFRKDKDAVMTRLLYPEARFTKV